MKYLHSGYILFCHKAEHAEQSSGQVNLFGVFDLFIVKQLPATLECQCVVGFGTPYERRQYRGHIEIEDPQGKVVFRKEFNANDPEDLFRGHSIFPVDISITAEGSWTIRCSLYNWKNENVWEVSRQLWAMIEDPAPKPQETFASES